MTRRVVFAGGTQAKALAKAYRLDIALDSDDDVYFIGADSIGRDAAKKVVSAADVLVTDLTPLGPTVPEAMISVGTLRIAVPVVTADFLWPYAAKGHPRNMYASGLPDGPYPAGFGDSYLDMLAEDGLPEDEAVARYLALDVAEDAGLDRMLSDAVSVMARLDAETGFDLADFVPAHFRTDYLFATRDRMNMKLFRHIAGLLFGRMGVPPSRISQVSDTFFPVGAMPVHPAVLRHFKITTPAEDYRYPILDEGYFSFEAYCRRYYNYAFNRRLHAAIAKAEHNPSEAIPELRVALEESPESRSGLRALKDAERAVNDATMLPPMSVSAPEPVRRIVPPAEAEAANGEQPATGARTEAGPALPGTSLLRSTPPAEADPDDDEAPQDFVPKTVFGAALVRRKPTPEEDEPELAEPLPFTDFPVRHIGGPSFSPSVEATTYLREPDPPAPAAATAVVKDAEPQGYEELPHMAFGEGDAPPAPIVKAVPSTPGIGARYTPLPPAEHLIPLLPRMLPNPRGTVVPDKPFGDMAETMPPPPLKPVLPPELHPEPVRVSLVARIMDQLRR